MTETTTSADGSTIAYESAGSGPVLVVLGGAFNTRASAAGLVPLLADRFTVVTVDRRGRGGSTDASARDRAGLNVPDTADARAAIAREVDDVRAVIAATGGTAVLYGHSSGASLALEVAAAEPGAGRVAAYEPPYPVSAQGDRTDEAAEAVRSALEAGDAETAARRFLAGIGMDPEQAASAPWWGGMVALAPTLLYDLALTAARPEGLERIAAPVLLLAGGDSPAWMRDSVSETAALLPEVATRALPGQTHAVADDALAPVLTDFLLGA